MLRAIEIACKQGLCFNTAINFFMLLIVFTILLPVDLGCALQM